MGHRVGKVWGSTEIILSTPVLEIHRLLIKPNAHCSLHCHNFKWNYFLVLSGTLAIEVHKSSYQLVDVTELDAGDHTTVRPGEFHRFISGTVPVEALEVYYPEMLSEDIVRKDCGGVE